jgi:predicted RNA-binding protein Jag
LDIKIFHKIDGGIIQLIDKEKMEEWPIELPLIFVEYIRTKKLDSYGDSKVKREIEDYLDEVTKDVAIPRLISVLESNNEEEIILALNRIEELSNKDIEMVSPIKVYLNNLITRKNEKISNLANKISENFQKTEKRKELAQKRKLMREKEKLFLEGKISAEEYAKARKEYLTLRE